MARQPWKLTRLLRPLLVSALLPMRLCELLPNVRAVADMLDAFDAKPRVRQVEHFRTDCLGLRSAA